MSLALDLRSSVSAMVRERGSSLYAFGKVKITAGDKETVSAEVQGSNLYEVELRREKDQILAFCDCPYFDSDGICKHIWAVVLAADKANALGGANGQRVKKLIEDWDGPFDLGPNEEDDDEDDQPFDLKPPPLARGLSKPQQPQWKTLIQQLPAPASQRAEGWRPGSELYYVLDLQNSPYSEIMNLEVLGRERKKDGAWGKLKGSRISREGIVKMPSDIDREILMMLGGTPLPYDWSNRDTIPYGFNLEGSAAPLLLSRICATGRCLWRRDRNQTLEAMTRMNFDDGPPWQFSLRLSRDGESWKMHGAFTRNSEQLNADQVPLVFACGLLVAGTSFARYEGSGAWRWANLLRRNGPIHVPVPDSDEFLLHMLNQHEMPPVDWPEELRITEVAPEFHAHLRLQPQRAGGKDATLCAFASFVYDGMEISANEKAASLFDPAQRRILRRDLAGEQSRLQELAKLGFKADTNRYESAPHHHIHAKKLPASLRDLIGNGWQVAIEGKPFRKSSGSRSELTSGVDWFELRATVDYDGAVARLPDLLKAVKQNSTLVELSDGSFGVLPEELIKKFGVLLGTGKAEGDHLRFSRSQTALLDTLLASRPEIQVDETFLRAREQLKSFESIQPAVQPAGFGGTLRDYQRDGLAWMRFLQDMGFGGCLADDMGLGKTAQVLAMLEQRREMREKGEKLGPSLAVVPRSLIFNWIQEAQRFTPKLNVLDHSGADRKRREPDFSRYDLVLTTYGVIRRDIAKLQDVKFDYAILDEAQAIKNADSDSAKSVRLIDARHRLALSGTPIQNHLGDLFSLFEFLNPGMLGSVRALSTVGLSVREPDQAMREMLALAVRPFLLRRTKDQVARELPERTEQTIYCELDAGERKQYNELREHYRAALLGRIEEAGIAKSQMHILEALLRLRQAACHPGLLDAKRKGESSAKLESLLAHLAEVLSEGHKALVFSQFTSLLSVVRAALDREGTVYEYLDGRTRDRQSRVERFQNDPTCKLFLISLKAGGVGMNLTAADYVFLLDPWWNPAVEAQAIDRTHRIGQINSVFAYRLIARDTVEEKVLELQHHKRNLADAIIRADASLISNLKREDLEFLLS